MSSLATGCCCCVALCSLSPAMSSAAVASDPSLRVTPYTRPRDVLVWNRDAKSWLLLDLSAELDPTISWLRVAIVRQLGVADSKCARVFLNGCSCWALGLKHDDEPLEYYTLGHIAARWHEPQRSV